MSEQVFDFENLNLNDVDPTFKPIDEGPYILKLMSLLWKESKGTKETNKDVVYVSINGKFAVDNHPKFSGRKLYHNFFLGNSFEQKALRRIADATGVSQNPGETLKDWAARISTTNPSFKVAVKVQQAIDFTTKEGRVDVDGAPILENKIDFRNVGIV